MALRIITGLIGVPLLVLIIWAGGIWLTILVLVAALIGLQEFYRMARGTGADVAPVFGALWTTLFVLNGQLAARWGNYAPHIFGGGLLISLGGLYWFRDRDKALVGWGYTVAGPLYVGLLLSYALLLRGGGDGLYNGRDWLLFALLTTFAADTGAFFAGRALGRHQMAPAISPRKTWEGLFGGLLLAIGVAAALAAALGLDAAWWQELLLGAAVGVAAPVGDLLESKLKRISGVKDTGTIIPGHGGMLDRLDSIVLTLPVVYYLLAAVY